MAKRTCRACGLTYRLGRHRGCFEIERDRRMAAEAVAMFMADVGSITEADIDRMYQNRWARRRRETSHGG